MSDSAVDSPDRRVPRVGRRGSAPVTAAMSAAISTLPEEAGAVQSAVPWRVGKRTTALCVVAEHGFAVIAEGGGPALRFVLRRSADGDQDAVITRLRLGYLAARV